MIIYQVINAISTWANGVRVLDAGFVLIEALYCRTEKLKSLRNLSSFKRRLLFGVVVSARSRHCFVVFIFEDINVSIKPTTSSCVGTLSNGSCRTALNYCIS